MSMCTSDPFPTYGADIPVDGSILRPFGVPGMIKSCKNLCPRKGPKFVIFSSKKVPFGSKKGPNGALGRPGSPWDAPGVLLEHFG